MKPGRLKIGYISMTDPMDRRSWSGTTYYIRESLNKYVGDVENLGPITIPRRIHRVLNALTKINRVLFGKTYVTKYSVVLAKYMGKVFTEKLAGKQFDILVAPAASTELSYIKTDIPIVYISDATFKLISNYYVNDFKDTSSMTLRDGNTNEKRSLEKSSLVIYTSRWAGNSAINDYGINPEKVKTILLGANMDYTPDRSVIEAKEKNNVLTLLYLAVEWERKGGPIAFAALKHLQKLGVKAKLIVCGCTPPAQFVSEDMEVIPFLNKNKADDHDRFVQVLTEAHFLILPTRADCSLLVACESNAYGTPAIATDTGGVSDVVRDGINGYCLPFEAEGDAYAELILKLYNNKEGYKQLVASSRDRFEQVNNWEKWAEQFKALYAERFKS